MWRCIALGMLLSVAGCEHEQADGDVVEKTSASGELTEKPSNKTENPITGEWSLVAIDQNPLSSGGTPTLVFESDGRCWGSTGVNKFNAQASFEKLADGWLTLGPAAVTRMAGPPEAMVLEGLFLQRLEKVSAFEVEGDTLHLFAGSQETATFERVYR
jgi:heat shock protein HslJ